MVSDSSETILSSLKSVAETLVLAILISMVIIWLFLGDIKASLIVGSSIPVSILVCLICMSRMGLTLNIITLCALTLGVGMMVDNSIVVMESCFRATDNRPSGFVEYMKDALEGTNVVCSSVVASTVTTCVVFLPLAMLNGMTGQLLGPLGYTIVIQHGSLSFVGNHGGAAVLYAVSPEGEEKCSLILTDCRAAAKLSDSYEDDSAA